MSWLDHFAYVKLLKQRIAEYERGTAVLEADIKKLVDTLCATKQIMAPFGSHDRLTMPEDWAVLRRSSVAREIAELEASHNTKRGDE